MWYIVVFQPSKCKKTHFQPQIWSIWPIFPNDSESLPKVCYIKQKNSKILSKLRNSESAGGSDITPGHLSVLRREEWTAATRASTSPTTTALLIFWKGDDAGFRRSFQLHWQHWQDASFEIAPWTIIHIKLVRYIKLVKYMISGWIISLACYHMLNIMLATWSITSDISTNT